MEPKVIGRNTIENVYFLTGQSTNGTEYYGWTTNITLIGNYRNALILHAGKIPDMSEGTLTISDKQLTQLAVDSINALCITHDAQGKYCLKGHIPFIPCFGTKEERDKKFKIYEPYETAELIKPLLKYTWGF